jgi:hypothetical protein
MNEQEPDSDEKIGESALTGDAAAERMIGK